MSVKITLASKQDVSEIKVISDLRLGINYLSSEILHSAIIDFNQELYVAKQGNTVRAFLLVKLNQASNAIIKEPFDLIKAIAVHPEYSKQGIASLLISNFLLQFTHERALYTYIWKQPDNHLPKLLKKLNFNPIKEIPNHWKARSIQTGFICPICGTPPCLCTMELWKLFA